jgi:hypothetical protein
MLALLQHCTWRLLLVCTQALQPSTRAAAAHKYKEQVLVPARNVETCLQGSNIWQEITGPCRSHTSHDPIFQGAALAEELTGLRTEVGDFSSAVERLQRQRAEQRSELLEFQSALQVCTACSLLMYITTTSTQHTAWLMSDPQVLTGRPATSPE